MQLLQYVLSLCLPLSVVGHNPPEFHCDRFDVVRDAVLPPGVPHDMRPLPMVPLAVLRGGVEVSQAALVEPPTSVVVLGAAALHRAVVDGAGRVTAVVVYIRGAEWSSVLIVLLIIATKCITCTHTQALRYALFALC